MSDDLRYPVGLFESPTQFDESTVSDSIEVLRGLPSAIATAVDGLTEEQLETPYRDGGWTVRQVVHHVADSHQHAYIRTKLGLTEDRPTILAYQEKLWAELPDASGMPVEVSLSLLSGLHARWVRVLETLEMDAWSRTIIHPEMDQPVSMWVLLALYDWHSRHHVAHITGLRTSRGW